MANEVMLAFEEFRTELSAYKIINIDFYFLQIDYFNETIPTVRQELIACIL